MAVFLSMIVGAYLLGSIPAGVMAGRILRGIDVREHGSGNPGTSNALRILGPGPALAVLLIDVGKGWLATAVAFRIDVDGLPFDDAWVPLIVGLAAVAGHLWPVWVGFRGGKGVATGAGVMAALEPLAMLIGALVFLVVVAASRWVSLGSMVSAISMPLVIVALQRLGGIDVPPRTLVAAALLALLILLNHRSNIQDLLAGKERKISFHPR